MQPEKPGLKQFLGQFVYFALIVFMLVYFIFGYVLNQLSEETERLLFYLVLICMALFIIIENPYKSWYRDMVAKTKKAQETQSKPPWEEKRRKIDNYVVLLVVSLIPAAIAVMFLRLNMDLMLEIGTVLPIELLVIIIIAISLGLLFLLSRKYSLEKVAEWSAFAYLIFGLLVLLPAIVPILTMVVILVAVLTVLFLLNKAFFSK